MIAADLQKLIDAAQIAAKEARHRFVTPEHVLLQALDEPAAAGLLKNAAIDVPSIRAALQEHISRFEVLRSDDESIEPSRHLHGLMQRAILDAQTHHRFEVTVKDIVSRLLDREQTPISIVRELVQ